MERARKLDRMDRHARTVRARRKGRESPARGAMDTQNRWYRINGVEHRQERLAAISAEEQMSED